MTVSMPLLIVAVFVVRGVSEYIAQYAISWVGNRVVMDLRNAMFDKLLMLPTAYYDSRPTGNLISKVTFDVSQVTNAATSVLTIMRLSDSAHDLVPQRRRNPLVRIERQHPVAGGTVERAIFLRAVSGPVSGHVELYAEAAADLRRAVAAARIDDDDLVRPPHGFDATGDHALIVAHDDDGRDTRAAPLRVRGHPGDGVHRALNETRPGRVACRADARSA